MSTYNEIKKSIDQVRKDIVGIKRNLSRNEEDQREIRRAVDKAESTFQLNLRQEKDTAQQELLYCNSCLEWKHSTRFTTCDYRQRLCRCTDLI